MSAAFGWLSVLPPAVAIGTALGTRRVLPALSVGVLCAALVLHGTAPHTAPARAIDALIRVLTDAGNLRLVMFSVLVGGLLRLIKDSGGFDAFVNLLERRRGAYGRGTAYSLTWLFGGSLVLETWSNVLINSATLGPLYDRLGLSRARLAYFAHTIGINVVALVLINSWGAFYLALVAAQDVARPLDLVLASIPYALYCWISLLLVAAVMLSGLTIGPMRQFDREARTAASMPPPAPARDVRAPRLRHMLLPIGALIGGVFASLWITGGGEITAGDGSASILYAVVGAIAVTALILRIDRVFDTSTIERKVLAGCAEFLDVGVLLMLALTLGQLTRELGTGPFVAQLLGGTLPIATIPALVFALGACMSFATGTSYGTFSIMVPIALPIGAATGIAPEILFGACIAGGVFGDNCSPISDTSIVTGLAAGIPVIDHTRTQLPYALIAAALSVAGYLLIGIV